MEVSRLSTDVVLASFVDGDVRVFDPVAGGEALLVIDIGSKVQALAVFADPATGAPRLACGCWTTARRSIRRGNMDRK